MKAWSSVGAMAGLSIVAFASQPGCGFSDVTCAERMNCASGPGSPGTTAPPSEGGKGERLLPVPSGWSGYDWIRSSSAQDAVPTCPLGMKQSAYHQGPLDDPAQNPWCGACGCTAAGATCERKAKCMGISPVFLEGCPDLEAYGPLSTCHLLDATAVGACVVTGEARLDAPSFQTRVDVCTGAQKMSGLLQCIHRDGQQASCPEAWPDRHVAYADFSDERTCACTCSLSCTGGGLYIYEKSACEGRASQPQGQVYMSSTIRSIFVDPGAPTCTASPAVPSGKVVPKAPVTFCCR